MMVVVGIVAILALMTIPSFLDQYIRNQIVEALPLADIAKAPVAASWAVTRTLPADNASIGLPVPEKVVNNIISALTVEGGAIHITFGNRANNSIKGKILSLRPAIVADAPIVPVAWVCGYAAVPGNMTAVGENRTNIPAGYLPVQCRGG
jgi:type IV pilus assembly protein PilA